MIEAKLINKFQSFVNSGEKIILIGHEQPDGDAVGSTLAMASYLEDQGKKVTRVFADKVPKIFDFLKDLHKIKKDFLLGDTDLIILLDNGDLKRTGYYQRILKAKEKKIPIINIDHHLQNDVWKIASLNLAYPGASSTCEIMYELFSHLDYEIENSVATYLLCGIYGDTGGFQHPNTSEKVMNITSELLRSGGKLKKVAAGISQSKSVPALKLWGRAIEHSTFNKNLGLIVSVLTAKDIKECEASEEDISGLINLLNTTPEARANLLIYEAENGKIRGSLRTYFSDVDVSEIAKLFGGGGHKRAAGFSVSGRIKKTAQTYQIA